MPTNSRFAKDIAAIKEQGIIQGFDDGTFRPNHYMTRAEMAVIVGRPLIYKIPKCLWLAVTIKILIHLIGHMMPSLL